MQINLISLLIKHGVATVLIAIVLGYFTSDYSAYAFILGSLGGLVNFLLIKKLIELCFKDKRNLVFILCIFAIKFPLIYLTGYKILSYNLLPPIPLLIGMGLIFLSLFFSIRKPTSVRV